MISKVFVESCINSLHDWAGIEPPNKEVFAEWLESKPDVAACSEWYPGDEVKGSESLDTADRDLLMDTVSMEFGGRNWPMNMEGQEALETLMEKMIPNLVKAGWKIVKE